MANNPQNPQFNQGDILGLISDDVVQIKNTTYDIKSDTELLKSIDRNLAAILQNSSNWSQQSARSRIYDTASNNQQSSGGYDRSRSNRGRGGSGNYGSSEVDGFLDTFFKELQRGALGSGFRGAIEQGMKDFADALGVQTRDIPKFFGKALANAVQQTQMGRALNNRIRQAMDSMYGAAERNFRRGANRYLDRRVQRGTMSGQDAGEQRRIIDDLLGKWRHSYEGRFNTPPQGPQGPGQSPDPTNPQNENNPAGQANEMSAVLNDKLQYLYPIYTTLQLVNDGVRILAEYWTSGDDSMSEAMEVFNSTQDQVNSNNNSFIEGLLNTQNAPGNFRDLVGQVGETSMSTLTEMQGAAAAAGTTLDAGAALAGVAAAAGPLILGFVALQAGTMLLDAALDAVVDAFAPLTESFKNLMESFKKVANRYFESERKKIQDETTRLREDVRTLVEAPFDILKQATEDWYNAWDNNLKVINATQGYSKSDLQSLMSSYAQRVQQEGLDKVISSADISNNLAKVLESGLSGTAAEEFAYIATLLNNAIPTEDFFAYSSIYASMAATQMSLGKSQKEALTAANEQLTQFASNLLYSNRELAGGFGAGLKDATKLLESAVQIANTAGVGDSSIISGALTAISSTVGAVAPDLAGTVTDAIINAALGGNSEELVALRSLANTGAANTAFLNAFARDPKGVLNTLFTNLSNLQRMNKDNFMEIAESLSSTFGMSVGAFTRVDFASVASAVSKMNVSLDSIDSNMALVKQGQTTTTAEQLKMQQINEVILNEGLSYVLDNQAARSIQEHMWQQEIAAEIMETEYSVELQGKALEFLSGIFETINNIMNFLNPLGWLKGIFSIGATMAESYALKKDIKKVLEAGKVGQGNKSALYNLTTYDVDRLNNKPGNLIEMMGGSSSYRNTANVRKIGNALLSLGFGHEYSIMDALFYNRQKSGTNGAAASRYSWNYVTKGLSDSIGNSPNTSYASSKSNVTATQLTTSSAQTQVTDKNTQNLTEYLDTMQSFVEDNKSFKDWKSSAKKYGIADLEGALKPYDLTMTDLQNKYQEYEAAQGSEYKYNQDERQQQIWDKLEKFFDEDFPSMFDDIITRLDTQIELMTNIDTTLTSFLDSWKNEWLMKAWAVDWLQTAWRQEWINTAWRAEWVENAWNKNWLQSAWGTDWLQNAWRTEWLENAWAKQWLEDAWTNSWLTQSWGTDWLQNAWRTEWIENAWKTNWLQAAWTQQWIEKAWKIDWLQKAWKETWIEKGWRAEWLEKSWGQLWLQQAWAKSWLQENWGAKWLQGAWAQDWLKDNWQSKWIKDAWKTDWIQRAWAQDWIEKGWKQLWIKNTWGKEWVKETWTEGWVKTAWGKEFVTDIVKVLWGNRWWEFFNIFRDRFGGIRTEATNNGENGKTSIDTSDLYTIYAAETGKAAAQALKDVQSEESSETGDAVLSLAKQLTKNSVELRDPQVQTNVLLSQILIVLEAIMQAENVSGGASLATTLAALGMGATMPNTSNSAGTQQGVTFV